MQLYIFSYLHSILEFLQFFVELFLEYENNNMVQVKSI